MKKFISILLAIVTLLGSMVILSSCRTRICSKPKKITDYLYEITYRDYREDYDLETIGKAETFGCSSVRNGNFYGRNFDYIFNDTPEFIVKVAASENRHASIGIATHFGLREDQIKSYDKQLELIPNLTLDGINDAGVICSHNVVAIEDGNIVTGTNPSGKDLHMLFVPRFVLDNASSADEAIELIRSRNIYGSLEGKNYLHIMIADKDKTYIVEFFSNDVIVREKFDDKQIMTNYYLNLNTKAIQDHGSGVERYQILQENYELGSTFDGMQELLKLVQFSNAYKFDVENPWLSEHFTQPMIKSGVAEREEIKSKMWLLQQEYENTIKLNQREKADPTYWITVHNSTYDIENRTLRVYVQEKYDKYYEYKLE